MAMSRMDAAEDVGHQTSILGWVLRKTLLAICIMVVVVGAAAWILHASIDVSADEQASGRTSELAITNARLND